jgi:dienelactone hydrolase
MYFTGHRFAPVSPSIKALKFYKKRSVQLVKALPSSVVGFLLTLFLPIQAQPAPLVYQLYLVDKPAPTVIVGHPCSGALGHPDDWAQQLNEWGFNAVNLDSFTPRKLRDVCLGGVPSWPRSKDAYEMAEIIKKADWHSGKIGYIGFSHGASTGIYIAKDKSNKHIDAVVSYYPACIELHQSTISIFDRPKIPIMLALGAADDWTPAADCLANRKDFEVHVFDNAHHSFDVPRFRGARPARCFKGYCTVEFNDEANRSSRVTTRKFFRKYLEGIEDLDDRLSTFQLPEVSPEESARLAKEDALFKAMTEAIREVETPQEKWPNK